MQEDIENKSLTLIINTSNSRHRIHEVSAIFQR